MKLVFLALATCALAVSGAEATAKFEGRKIVVLGGSAGMGLAAAIDFLEGGAQVVISSRRKSKIEGIIADLPAPLQKLAIAASCDAGSDEEIEALMQLARDQMGGIDGLVYIPTYMGPGALGSFEELRQSGLIKTGFEATGRLNIGQFLVALDYSIDDLVASGRSTVVVISSIAATWRAGGQILYGGAKANLEATIQYLALEYAEKGVRFNAFRAGCYATDILTAFASAEVGASMWRRAANEFVPLKRVGTAKEAGRFISFLSSDDSSFMTGQALEAGGGHAIAGAQTFNTPVFLPEDDFVPSEAPPKEEL